MWSIYIFFYNTPIPNFNSFINYCYTTIMIAPFYILFPFRFGSFLLLAFILISFHFFELPYLLHFYFHFIHVKLIYNIAYPFIFIFSKSWIFKFSAFTLLFTSLFPPLLSLFFTLLHFLQQFYHILTIHIFFNFHFFWHSLYIIVILFFQFYYILYFTSFFSLMIIFPSYLCLSNNTNLLSKTINSVD